MQEDRATHPLTDDLSGRISEALVRRGIEFAFAPSEIVITSTGMRIPLARFASDFERALARLDALLAYPTSGPRSQASADQQSRVGHPGNEFDLSGRHISEKSG